MLRRGIGGCRLLSSKVFPGFSSAGALADIVKPSDCMVFEDFLTKGEHDSLANEIVSDDCDLRLQRFRRKKYEMDHWDSVIKGYKELERHIEFWNESNAKTLRKTQAFIHEHLKAHVDDCVNLDWLPPHIIDLASDGAISPHVDSIKFSGKVVAGLSLLSERTMWLRLADQQTDTPKICLKLPPRSLYILCNKARYELAHSVECNPSSERRLSIIFRDRLL